MNGVMTATRSRTDSFTESRLAAVMPEVGADFYSMAGAGLLPLDMAMKWTEELSFILKHRAARGFQVQLTCPGRDKIALDYRVSSDALRARIALAVERAVPVLHRRGGRTVRESALSLG